MEMTAPGAIDSPALQAVRARIAQRFGLVPSFFMMARAEPPIVDAMFGLVEFAYFDSPLPALFKERLFTYVSRYCRVPYCMARHCAFLLGCGNVAGDPGADGISVEEAVMLIRTPFPDAARRHALLEKLRAAGTDLASWPDPKSDLAETVFFAAAVAFVMPREHKPLLAQLERVLGAPRFNYLMLFLGFIRFAHFWTESHQELRLEEDIEHLLDQQRTLAVWVAAYPDEVDSELVRARTELRELVLLRERTEKSETTVAELQEAVAFQTRAVRVAEAESQAKATFMATVSHELRTPLNAVLGYVGLLEAGLGGELEEQAKRYIGRIKSTARHQQQIIDEILSFSRLEAGRETVRNGFVSLEELHDEVSAVISPLAEARGLSFTLAFPDAPVEFITDPGKLRQVLLNLLGNAVKFTPAGQVALTVAESGESVVFTVDDTGPGIPAGDRERIFDAFTQLDAAATREQGGTGLGLAISKRLVALLNGSIQVRSREGTGSSFVVTLPSRGSRVS
jgi:signal transduction histidine kinase